MVNAAPTHNAAHDPGAENLETTTSATPSRGNPVFERSLGELRSGRRLEKITSSIESFLLSQVSRLEKSLTQCQAAVEQNQVVQRIRSEFERQREAWELERQAEIRRLYEASEKLARGWKQLEEERQNWIADRPPGYAGKSK